MIHIPDISTMMVRRPEPDDESLTIRCMGGHARWTSVLGTLILQADIVMDAVARSALEFLEAKESPFELEISYSFPHRENSTTRFLNCRAQEVAGRDLATGYGGQPCRRYQMAIRAEAAAGGENG